MMIMDVSKGKNKNKVGWMIIAEKSMKKIWDNKKDDEVWNKYI